MREIEKTIIREIQFGNNNQIEKNFSCRDRLKKEGYNQYKIYLWDSLIFCHSAKTNKFYFSFAGYSTNTTKSRINSFLQGVAGCGCCGISQKNFELVFSSPAETKVIDSSKWYEIDNINKTISEIENINDVL